MGLFLFKFWRPRNTQRSKKQDSPMLIVSGFIIRGYKGSLFPHEPKNILNVLDKIPNIRIFDYLCIKNMKVFKLIHH